MIDVVDEVLAGEPRFTIKDNAGNILYDNVQIELKTQVTTEGTPQNKALYDSIKTDLTNLSNSKLNISAKASQAQAQAGTNDTNYTTPLKVRQGIAALTTEKNMTSSGTVFDFTAATGTLITIQGTFGVTSGTSTATLSLGGVYGVRNQSGTSISSTDFKGASSDNVFSFVFDTYAKTFTGVIHYITGSSTYTQHYDWLMGTISTPTPTLTLYGNNSSCKCLITQNK